LVEIGCTCMDLRKETLQKEALWYIAQ
jgi:hypothetical protein